MADTSHLKPGQKMAARPAPTEAPPTEAPPSEAPAEQAAPSHAAPSHAVAADEHGHPGPRTYVMVALWLAVATAIEVGLYYIDMPVGLFIAALMLLMIIKFVTVIAYFMHLKYDAPIFRRLMITGIILAISVYVIVLATFGLFR